MKKTTLDKPLRSPSAARQKDPNRYPRGWDRKRVEAVIAHYENQTDAEAEAEDEAAYRDPAITMMAIPVELVEQVRKLISRKRAS